jgi:hypothetical protein
VFYSGMGGGIGGSEESATSWRLELTAEAVLAF